MALTPAQLPTLKAAIAAETDPTFVEYRTNGDNGGMAAFYNEASNPAFVVWRTTVSQDEITQNGFDWVRVDNLSVGKARIWEWMFGNAQRVMNPSKANVRAGIDEAWKGTAADLAVRAAVYVHCKRAAKRGEALYTTGTGTDAVPGELVFEGSINPSDITAARNLE
jgi:hypothetical protein